MTSATAEGYNGNYPGKGIGTPVGIAVLGKGTVGTEVLRLISEFGPSLEQRIGGPIEVLVANQVTVLVDAADGFTPTGPWVGRFVTGPEDGMFEAEFFASATFEKSGFREPLWQED